MEIIKPDSEIRFTEKAAVMLGFFDGLHLGHAAVIGAAKQTGLKTVLLTFLQHPSALLDGGSVRLITDRAYKEELLRELRVDVVAYLDFASIKELTADDFVRDILIDRFNAGVVLCGFNYRFGRGGKAGPEELKRLCAQYGAETFCHKPVCKDGEVVSSTRIRALIEKGEVKQAARLLGRPFSIRAEVVHGARLGRRLGIPTINQRLAEGLVIPRFGVYASLAHVGGLVPAVTNIGVKPTVGSDGVTVESHLLDYSADLYGRTIRIDLMDFIRPERTFESLQALRAQIAADVRAAGEMFARREAHVRQGG